MVGSVGGVPVPGSVAAVTLSVGLGVAVRLGAVVGSAVGDNVSPS